MIGTGVVGANVRITDPLELTPPASATAWCGQSVTTCTATVTRLIRCTGGGYCTGSSHIKVECSWQGYAAVQVSLECELEDVS
ncbi:MAG TPA: hypothetical protein VGB64_06150 [Actinomycetota bacterium]